MREERGEGLACWQAGCSSGGKHGDGMATGNGAQHVLSVSIATCPWIQRRMLVGPFSLLFSPRADETSWASEGVVLVERERDPYHVFSRPG